MKNLLIYTREDKQFSHENKRLSKIQVDNSLDMGWKREDIQIFTNFPFEHNGVKSTIVPDLSCKWDRSNKIPAILYLFENKLIQDDEYWYHDWDAVQDHEFEGNELEGVDMSFTVYGYKKQFNCGSFFFKLASEYFFDFWNGEINKTIRNRADEKTLTDLHEEGAMDLSDFRILDLSYNYGQKLPNIVDIPARVLHFHPNYRQNGAKFTNIEIFMHGKNKFGHPFMSDRLIKIYNKHGYA